PAARLSANHRAPTLLLLFAIFSNDSPPTQISTLSLHDALPISDLPELEQELHGRARAGQVPGRLRRDPLAPAHGRLADSAAAARSEEHTSELQSLTNLVCRLLLEKKKNGARVNTTPHACRDPHI